MTNSAVFEDCEFDWRQGMAGGGLLLRLLFVVTRYARRELHVSSTSNKRSLIEVS